MNDSWAGRNRGLSSSVEAVVGRHRRRDRVLLCYLVAGSTIALASLAYSDVFDLGRYGGASRAFVDLAADAFPPDFSRWRALVQQWEQMVLARHHAVAATESKFPR